MENRGLTCRMSRNIDDVYDEFPLPLGEWVRARGAINSVPSPRITSGASSHSSPVKGEEDGKQGARRMFAELFFAAIFFFATSAQAQKLEQIVAEAKKEDKTFEDVLRRADRMMYKAKEAGRNTVAANE